MANFEEPNEEMLTGWEQWVRERPPALEQLIRERQFAPWKLYWLKSSGHYVQIYSFQEPKDPKLPVLMTVLVLARWQRLAFERRVFDIDPSELEECDLPDPRLPTGATYRQEELTPELMRALAEREHSKLN